MDLNKTLQTYLDELTSSSPTPGGGNVAALCGVLASSLGAMVCNLTIGKKKYAAVEVEFMELEKKLCTLKEKFVLLAKKDNAAFDKVMDAFKLPKESEEQKKMRSQAIENATLVAAQIPSEVIAACKDLLPLLEIVSIKGNQNSLSDAGVGIALTSTAAEGAFLNVLINCSSLNNRATAEDILSKAKSSYDDIKGKATTLISQLMEKMKS
jgi:formiminotetrahydrofolate cyclodeaminase